MINMTTAWFTTTAAPTTEATTEASTVMATTATYSGNFSAVNRTRHKEEKSKKKTKLRSELVGSISTAAKSITSVENLEQMTRAMSSITNNPKEIDTDAQKKAA